MYASRAAGCHYSHQGGAANYICLPNNSSYLQYTSGHQLDRDYIYGSEYETCKNGPLSSVHNHNVPCMKKRNIAHDTCMGHLPSSWTQEYNGYLMSECHTYHRTMHIFINKSPETVSGRIYVLQMQVGLYSANLCRDWLSSIHSWERTGLCSMNQVKRLMLHVTDCVNNEHFCFPLCSKQLNLVDAA